MTEGDLKKPHNKKRNRLSTWLMLLLFLCAVILIFKIDYDDYRLKSDCSDHLKTIRSKQFLLEKNGIAVDKKSGIRWYRCNAGQRFINNSCTGKALTFDWEEAMDFPEELTKLTSLNWRLPTKEEAQSLRRPDCINPAIDQTVFPDIRVANYWTGSQSRRGALFGCSFYTYDGRISCLMRREKAHPIMLVLD